MGTVVCPFCGGLESILPIKVIMKDPLNNRTLIRIQIHCHNCGAGGPLAKEEEQAWEKWMNRYYA